MLQSLNLNNRTYDEWLSESLMQIPLHTSEWTNFNVSDPGVTVLQNLTSFNLLQQSYLNEVSEPVQLALLKLAGFTPAVPAPARSLLEVKKLSARTELPRHSKLRTEDVCFEPAQPGVIMPWSVRAVYAEADGVPNDITYLMERGVSSGAAVFGSPARDGNALVFILAGNPDLKIGVSFYLQIESGKRNAYHSDFSVNMAKTAWQAYTKDGWCDIPFSDNTHAMLFNGQVSLYDGQRELEFCDDYEAKGYAIRCVLEHGAYDIAPRLQSVCANVIEIVQQETIAAGFLFEGSGQVTVCSELVSHGNLFVYCREAEGSPYFEYMPSDGTGVEGRYYDVINEDDCTAYIFFDRERYLHAPCGCPDAVLAVCYTEAALHKRVTGPVYDYDLQELELNLDGTVLPDSFTALVRTVRDGVFTYEIARPSETNPVLPRYVVDAGKNCLRVQRPGLGANCTLLLCDCAVSMGKGGNIRPGIPFKADREELFPGAVLSNPAPSEGGVDNETSLQLRARFVREFQSATTAVTASDYETIVRATPGLCIQKVHAVVSEAGNLVEIAVMPYSPGQAAPSLPTEYQRQIMRWLEPFRVVTTKITLMQPQYIPIDVKAVIGIKGYHSDAQARITDFLRKELDFITSEHNFGDAVYPHGIHSGLEKLDCVGQIIELAFMPRTRSAVNLRNSEIRLANNCLCYPGNISLDITT